MLEVALVVLPASRREDRHPGAGVVGTSVSRSRQRREPVEIIRRSPRAVADAPVSRNGGTRISVWLRPRMRMVARDQRRNARIYPHRADRVTPRLYKIQRAVDAV